MAYSIVEVLDKYYSLKAGLKWPNDILIKGKKIGGILSEVIAEPGQINRIIMGVGININYYAKDLPGEIAQSAGTIMDF